MQPSLRGVPAAFASASYLRARLLRKDYDGVKSFIPESVLTILLEEIQTGRAPCSLAALERPILAALRNLSPEELAKLPDVSEGLEYRIASAVRKTTSLD